MGIFMCQFYFKQGFPKVADIQKTFHRITGLKVKLYSNVYMDELMTNGRDLMYHLLEKSEDRRWDSLNETYFVCSGFNDVYLDYLNPANKTLDLKYGAGKSNTYFYDAMMKTMQEVGGVTYRHPPFEEITDDSIEQFLEPYQPHTPFWMRIRKWDEMSDFEKERFLFNP